jgi:peptide-methionine (S)-S-oxide reductase
MELIMAKAIFAAGCFWGVEATFRQIPGVRATRVGYIGGQTPNPTYKDVCGDDTGHAEAVEVEYDPVQVSYEKLLDTFWENHDPTQLNRQGPDFGSQYRSAIFFTTAEQEKEAKASKEAREKSDAYRKPIVTQIVPEVTFYLGEDYHQQYLEKRGLATCHIK